QGIIVTIEKRISTPSGISDEKWQQPVLLNCPQGIPLSLYLAAPVVSESDRMRYHSQFFTSTVTEIRGIHNYSKRSCMLELTDEIIEMLPHHCPALEKIYFTTPFSVDVKKLAQGCPKLKHLVTDSPVTKVDMISLAEHCPQLENAHLHIDDGVTN